MTPLAYTSTHCGILYAEDFDAPPAPPRPPIYAQEPITVIDPAMVEDARREGFDAGWQAAETAARNDSEAAIAATLTAIFSHLDQARREQSAVSGQLARMLLDLVAGALAASLPSLMQTCGAAEVDTALRALLPKLDPNWELAISVRPDIMPELQRRLDCTTPRIAWTADEALDAGDVRVRWRHGEFVRDGRQILQSILPALSTLRSDEAIIFGKRDDAARV